MISLAPLTSEAAAVLAVSIDPAEVPQPLPPAAETRWRAMTTANPRLFNGTILSVVTADPATGSIVARRDRYARLALASEFALPVRQLSVTAVVTAIDLHAHQRFFLARRSGDTRIYPGLWELGPSGGIDPPAPPLARLTTADLAATLAREALEEASLDLSPSAAELTFVALLTDDHARSIDLVARCVLHTPIDHRRAAVCALAPDSSADRWEYLDAAWLTGDELAAFARDHPAALSPPTLTMISAPRLLAP